MLIVSFPHDEVLRPRPHASDEGVCIYLDGLSRHLHGNPATAAQDRRIRDWLRNNGYEVIEIAASELHDAGAMSKHFRRLAGYLGAAQLRDSLKTDTSWFQRVSDATEPAARFVLRKVQPTPDQRYVTSVPFVSLKAAAGHGC